MCPPRGPCESLPGAALWANILRVLYLHDNSIPKNELWRNGWKPGEVIGCRLGQGEGPGGVAAAAKKEKKGGGGAEKLRCNIKQSSRRICAPCVRSSGPELGTEGPPGAAGVHQGLQKPADQRPVKEEQAAAESQLLCTQTHPLAHPGGENETMCRYCAC